MFGIETYQGGSSAAYQQALFEALIMRKLTGSRIKTQFFKDDSDIYVFRTYMLDKTIEDLNPEMVDILTKLHIL